MFPARGAILIAAFSLLAGEHTARGTDSSQPSDNCDELSFALPAKTRDEIGNVLSRGVLRIQAATKSGTPAGTGYLIDPTHGIVVTAAHVVASVVRSKEGKVTTSVAGTEISFTISYFPKAAVNVAAGDTVPPKHDFAILKCLSACDRLTNLPRLEVEFSRPRKTDHLYSIGFPQSGTTGALPVDATFNGYTSQHTLQTDQTVDDGNSGGPLLDPSGAVMGTCIWRKNIRVAEYVPTNWFRDQFLATVPVRPAMEAIDATALAGTLEDWELGQQLDAADLSNLDLAHWADRIRAAPKKYNRYLNCPIGKALIDRKLYGSLVPFAESVAPGLAARAYVNLGLDAIDANDRETATRNLTRAATKLKEAIGESARDNTTDLTYVALRSHAVKSAARAQVLTAGHNHWLRAALEPTGAAVDSSRLDERFQSLWDDYAVVATRLSDLEPAKRLVWLREARLGSNMAYMLATTDRRQGKAAGVKGDANLRLGKARESAQSFATAYYLGYQEPWVPVNWEFAAKIAVADGASPKHLVKNGIRDAPRLSEDDVAKELKSSLRVSSMNIDK